MKEGETIDVLEIGGGSGTNFKSVPSHTSLIRLKAFDPKPMNQVLEKESQSSSVGAEPTLCEIF